MEGHRTRDNGHKQGHGALGETVFTIRVVRHWNRETERLWDLHPWRYSDLDRTCTKQPNAVGPALSGVGLETCRGPFQLKFLAILHLSANTPPPVPPSVLPACTCSQASAGAQRAPRCLTLAISFQTVLPFLHNSAKALTLLFQFLL